MTTKYKYVPEILEGKLERGTWEISPLKLHGLNCILYPMIRALQTVCELKVRVFILDIHILLKIRLENSVNFLYVKLDYCNRYSCQPSKHSQFPLVTHFYNHLCMSM